MGERTLPIHPDMTYQSLVQGFHWSIPEHFNMGVACSDEQPGDAPALRAIDSLGEVTTLTFGDVSDFSDRLAGKLSRLGVSRSDRIGLVLPQSIETGLMHLAIWKLGAISLPLASLFGPDALHYRLHDSESGLVVTNQDNRVKVNEARGDIDVLHVEGLLESLMNEAPIDGSASSRAEDPAYLIYTSGTTG